MLLLILTSLSLASSDSSWEPRYLSGLSLFTTYEETTNIGSYKVKYDYSYEDKVLNTPYKREEITSLMGKSLFYSLIKVESMGLDPEDCKVDLNIHLVQLDGQTLNNNDRYGSWRNINGGNLVTIYGLYDPTIDLYRNSVISFMLLPQGSDYVIVHEMAHYWYDRFCIYEKSNMKTEDFAKYVEDAYKTSQL